MTRKDTQGRKPGRGYGRRNQDKGAFGTASQLPSGRWRALHWGPDGKAGGRRYTAPSTFATKKDARAWLAAEHVDIERGEWSPPETRAHTAPAPAPVAVVTFGSYAATWLARRDLKPRTRAHYRKLIDGPLARLPLKTITADDIGAWYARLDPSTPTLRAHAYGLARTILATAVDDGRIGANPAHIRGAGSAKRAVVIRPASLDELAKLVDAMPEQYRAMVLLASWCALRFGELTELRCADVDLDDGLIRLRRAVTHTAATGFVVARPKSEAGVRDVAIPPHILPALRAHLVEHTAPGADSLLFPAVGGGHLASATLARHWDKARRAAGRPDLRFHDLRHTGAVLTAQTGATLAELMARLGHSTPQAALRYQHASAERDRALADRLSELANGNGH